MLSKKEQKEFDKKAKVLRKSQKDKEQKEIVQEQKEFRKRYLLEGSCDISQLFGIAGVYFLFKGTDIVYIGESSCIITRLSQHIKSKDFDSYKIERIKGVLERKEREVKLIKQYRPLLNFIHNPNMF